MQRHIHILANLAGVHTGNIPDSGVEFGNETKQITILYNGQY